MTFDMCGFVRLGDRELAQALARPRYARGVLGDGLVQHAAACPREAMPRAGYWIGTALCGLTVAISAGAARRPVAWKPGPAACVVCTSIAHP